MYLFNSRTQEHKNTISWFNDSQHYKSQLTKESFPECKVFHFNFNLTNVTTASMRMWNSQSIWKFSNVNFKTFNWYYVKCVPIEWQNWLKFKTDRVIKVLNDTELNEWQSKIKLKSFTFDKTKFVHSAQAYQISFLKTKFRRCEIWSCTDHKQNKNKKSFRSYKLC